MFGEYYPGLFAFDHLGIFFKPQKVKTKLWAKKGKLLPIRVVVSIVFCYPKNPDPSPPLHWRVQWFLEADWGWKLFEIPTKVYSGCRVFGGGFKPNLLFFWLGLIHLMVHVPPPEVTKHQHLNHSICFFYLEPLGDWITQRSTTKTQPNKNQHQHTHTHKNKHYHKTQPNKNQHQPNPHTKTNKQQVPQNTSRNKNNLPKSKKNTTHHTHKKHQKTTTKTHQAIKNNPAPFFFRDSKGLLFRRESAVEQCWLDTTNLLVHLGIGTHLWYHQGTTGPERYEWMTRMKMRKI